jgi:hypothetical protein
VNLAANGSTKTYLQSQSNAKLLTTALLTVCKTFVYIRLPPVKTDVYKFFCRSRRMFKQDTNNKFMKILIRRNELTSY